MTSAKSTTLLRALALGAALLVGAPRAAHACAWNWFHSFNPFPPCEARDQNVITRLGQANLKLAGKIATVSAKSVMVTQELYGWADAIRQADRIRQRAEAVYGRMNTDPLGSLAGSYTVMGVAMNFERDADGRLKVSPGGFDIRRMADSVFAQAFDSMGVAGLYNSLLADGGRGARFQGSYAQQVLKRQMKLLGDHERTRGLVRDSLLRRSQLAAREFSQERAGDKGLSEAQIAYLRNQMNRVRSTGVLGQNRSLQSQFSTFEDLTDRGIYYQRWLGITDRKATQF